MLVVDPLFQLPEVTPASDSCLRWRDGRHSWRRRRDGGYLFRLGPRRRRRWIQIGYPVMPYSAATLDRV